MKSRAERDKYKLNWAKCPEVMTGGKQYFYCVRTDDGMIWVVWDRIIKMWVVKTFDKTILARFKTVEEGKKYVERGYDNEN